MKKKFDLISFIFWIAIVFYLDPGGFRASGARGQIDSVKTTVILFSYVGVAWFCLYLKYRKQENSMINDKTLQSYTLVMIIWTLYYLLWYYGLNNTTGYPGPVRLILRNQRMISQILLVYPIAYFASIRLDGFIKILSWSTVVIMSMFILSIFFGLSLVDFAEGNRGMGLKVSRYFMSGYGIMWFALPLGLSLLIMKYKNEKILLLAALLVVVQIFLSILRRDIIGIVEYSLIIAFLVNYIHQSKTIIFLSRIINIKSTSFIFLVLVLITVKSPDTLETAQIIAENTYRTAILGEVDKETAGSSDEARMSLTAQVGIVKAIKENPILGTGFDPQWSTGDGGVKGFEGSDYIFLAAFGMYGLLGLLIFLPFYIITVKLIFRFVKLLRENLRIIRQNSAVFIYPVIVGIAASAEFTKNIVEYPMWFYPIGAVADTPRYFIYFGLLIGSYYQIMKHIAIYKLKKYEE